MSVFVWKVRVRPIRSTLRNRVLKGGRLRAKKPGDDSFDVLGSTLDFLTWAFTEGEDQMRRIIGLAVFVVVLLLPGAALAQTSETFSFDIPERIIRDATGSSHSLATHDVPVGLIGKGCTVEAVADNNASVHLNNDFIVSSGTGSLTLPNVERGPGAVTTSTAQLTLGETLSVTLFLGNNERGGGTKGIFSGGFTMNVICTSEPEPTPTPTPTEPEPSPSPSPSETETPDDGEVQSGGEVKSQQEVRGDDSASLPFTGPGIAGPLLCSMGLLGAGVSALWVARRK